MTDQLPATLSQPTHAAASARYRPRRATGMRFPGFIAKQARVR
jgi:hypothetical protein